MALIVLGAGATRGSSFVHGEHIVEADASGIERKTGICLPPLDSDFFKQLQRIQHTKHKPTVDHAISDAVELFGSNFSVTLEQMFTTLEHVLRMVGVTKGKWGMKRTALEEKRDNLKQALAAVLEESLTASSSGKGSRDLRSCEYHTSLVHQLAPSDAIISMNYDCLIDHALREHASGKWHAGYGYCLPRPPGPGSSIRGEEHWNPTNPAKKKASIRLLKLHGSLHFAQDSKDRWALKKRPYNRQRGNLRFEIIPPEWNKHFDTGIFGRIWAEAARETHKAETIVVVGYSFPATDLHTSALFRVSVANEKLRNIVIVNPDRQTRARTCDILKRGMRKSTRVMVFERFEEFAGTPRELWDQ